MVDTGSVSRAADALRIAQPALSQQLSALEQHFGRQLVVRSRQGIKPTQAGLVLYRNALVILKQLERAETEVASSGEAVSGKVSIGIAPYSAGSAVALPLLREVRARYPRILPHITESGYILSELVMNGTLDMAVLHGAGPMHGLQHRPLLREEFCLVCLTSLLPSRSEEASYAVAQLAALPMLLPPKQNFVRRAVDLAFTRASADMILAGEVESLSLLAQGINSGIGASIVPWSVARILARSDDVTMSRITHPTIEEAVSLCTSIETPLSEPARAVHDLLLDLTGIMTGSAAATTSEISPRRP